MKKLLLICGLSFFGFTLAMQQTPKADEWPADMPDLWAYVSKIKASVSRDEVLAEIRQAYSAEEQKLQEHFFDEQGLYIHFHDSKENIIQKFKNKPWFSEKELQRPVLLIPLN